MVKLVHGDQAIVERLHAEAIDGKTERRMAGFDRIDDGGAVLHFRRDQRAPEQCGRVSLGARRDHGISENAAGEGAALLRRLMLALAFQTAKDRKKLRCLDLRHWPVGDGFQVT